MGIFERASAQVWDVELHVDQAHPAAADSNAGTPTAPLSTIQEAAQRAVANKLAFTSTRVVVHAGTYRETVLLDTYTNYTGKPPNPTPMAFVAEPAGSVVISGADVWTDWTVDAATGYFTHAWPYDWGVYPNPTGGAREVAEIVRRRETVFVDGLHLRQVLTIEDLTAGSFYVDEAADLIYVDPPAGVDLTAAHVEVGIRERLWVQEWEDNVSVQGFVFRHAATHWQDAWAAVRVNSSTNVVLEDLRVEWNNGPGIYVGQTQNPTLRRVEMNDNGWDGLRMWRIVGGLVEDCTTNRNNWRGDWGAYYVWSVGNKIHNTHGLTLRRHQSVGNRSRGLWFDEDNENLVLEDVELSSNLSDGIFIEANQGPIRIETGRIADNSGFGIKAANTELLELVQTELVENERGAIEITGTNSGRTVTNFETGERPLLFTRGWTMEDNTIRDEAGGAPLLTTTLQDSAWGLYADSLQSDFNAWRHTTRPDIFELPGGRLLTFPEWQVETGQDSNSTYTGAPLPPPPRSRVYQQGLNGYEGASDTHIRASESSTSFGAVTPIGAAGADERALLRWTDLELPPDHRVDSVWVRLYVVDRVLDGGGYVLYPLLRDWDPATTTWNSPWAESGAGVGVDYDSAGVGILSANDQGWAEILLNAYGRDVVQGWIDEPASNNGFILFSHETGDRVTFVSADSPDGSRRPVLEVVHASGEPEPSSDTALAQSDIFVRGTVEGSYLDTRASDDIYQVLTERQSGGRPANRYSEAEHRWTFSVSPGASVTLYVEASRADNPDNDAFAFAYSTDNVDFTELPALTVDSATETVRSASLPVDISGTIYVRVRDTDQTTGNLSLDALSVDHIYIETLTGAVPPVAAFLGAPTSGSAPFTVQFTDQSVGLDEASTWNWDFGDGGTSSVQHPSYEYGALGEFTVTLTVTNAEGSDTETKAGYITVADLVPVHVAEITVTRESKGPQENAQAQVMVVDASGVPISGATVAGFFNEPNTNTLSGVTGSDGVAVIKSDKTRSPPAAGTWCFDVTGITHEAGPYDPGADVVTQGCDLAAPSGAKSDGGVSPAFHMAVEQQELPTEHALEQNYPNPFNPTTIISYALPEASQVRVRVFTATGREVARLVEGFREAGRHRAAFDASHLSAGVYLYVIEAGAFRAMRRMTVLK